MTECAELFPVLFAKSKTGKDQMWQVKTEMIEPNNIALIQMHGYVDGKIQTNTRYITTGKNIGKKNETSPLQQAISEAQSVWKKKYQEGYRSANQLKNIEKQNETNTNTNTEQTENNDTIQPPKPMLAQDYTKPLNKNKIKFPCFSQPKLDGVRCIALPNADGKSSLWSRNLKEFPELKHIKQELSTLPQNIVFDGELYSDTLSFQEVVGLVKKADLSDADTALQTQIYLCVYDLVDPIMPYSQRKLVLEELFCNQNLSHIRLLQTDECNSTEDVERLHTQYITDKYEGLMLRNKTGQYIGYRSKDLQKYKHFLDHEYKIVGYTSGDGLDKDCVIWRCVTEQGDEFSCRPRGTREARQDFNENGASYIGKLLTVRFQELSNDGIPRFPVGISIRDYE